MSSSLRTDYMSFLNKAREELYGAKRNANTIKVKDITAKQEQRIILERISDCFVYGFKPAPLIRS